MSSTPIQIRDALLENIDELRELAYLYAAVPLSWDSNFQVTDTESNQKWLIEKRSSLKCLVATLESKIIGIHILQKLENQPHICFIKTLWVDPKQRGKRISSQLKDAGEAWAKKEGCKTMITHVMMKNPKMLEINKRKGFTATKIELEKNLT